MKDVCGESFPVGGVQPEVADYPGRMNQVKEMQVASALAKLIL